ncbi:MAG: hypothetical protein KAX39_01540 [candidate division Zixibacteria bacterium]|nr:hypothetical protein [candidate division Zixibacteria bacterium]
MDDVRRFLRFTLPGLASVILLLITLVLSGDLETADIIRLQGAGESLGLILGVFLGSGGLGFLLSTVYFALYWSWPLDRLMAPDNRPFLRDFEKMIEIVDSEGKRYRIEALSRHEAWIIVNHYVASRIENVSEFKGIQSITDRLVDFTHAVGATFVGAFLSFMAWLCIHFPLKGGDVFGSNEIILFFVWLFLLFVIGLNRNHALKAAKSISLSAMAQRILKEFEIAGGKRVLLYYIK